MKKPLAVTFESTIDKFFGSKYSIDMEEYEYLLKGNSKEEEEEEMGRAALKIQAVHRGRKSRAEVQEIKEQTQAVNKIAAINPETIPTVNPPV